VGAGVITTTTLIYAYRPPEATVVWVRSWLRTLAAIQDLPVAA
jgi:hypothetical protein